MLAHQLSQHLQHLCPLREVRRNWMIDASCVDRPPLVRLYAKLVALRCLRQKATITSACNAQRAVCCVDGAWHLCDIAHQWLRCRGCNAVLTAAQLTVHQKIECSLRIVTIPSHYTALTLYCPLTILLSRCHTVRCSHAVTLC